MVIVVQLVRTPDCGSGGRGFESLLSPKIDSARWELKAKMLTRPQQIGTRFEGLRPYI